MANKFDNMSLDEIVKYIDKELEIYEREDKLIYKLDNIKDFSKDNIELLYNEYLYELNGLIGLDEVKDEIKKLIDYLIFIKKTNSFIKLDKINLNMIFRGNPGTGKTTVARIVAQILNNLGFLTTNKVLEVTPRDFIAGYIGQSGIKARETIAKAKGGLIFIDEAYSFLSDDEDNNAYSFEALTEIIKEMENLNTIFIFAGYEDKMNELIELNPGIKSRIGYDITFKDYTKEELTKMFYKKLSKSHMQLDEKSAIALGKKIEENMSVPDFGNGRMIDNLFNSIVKEHAKNNVYETNYEKLKTIKENSINKVMIKYKGGMNFG